MTSKTITTSLEQLDTTLTKNWQDVCLGRYAIKLPPELLEGKLKYTQYYDGYKITLLENQSQISFDALVKKTQAMIGTLAIPKGLKTALHRENKETKNQYLVAYRSAGKTSPELIEIQGFILIKNYILTIEGGGLDSFKNRFQGDKDQQGNTINWDSRFNKTYAIGERILRLSEAVKPKLFSRKIKPGTCIQNKVLIAADPVSSSFETLRFLASNAGYKVSVKILHHEKDDRHTSPFSGRYKQSGDEVYYMDTNNLKGSALRRLDEGYPEYKWLSENWSDKRSLNTPFIRIIFSENLESEYSGNYPMIDKIFLNLVSSFHLRQ
jgi:hypothetical protein